MTTIAFKTLNGRYAQVLGIADIQDFVQTANYDWTVTSPIDYAPATVSIQRELICRDSETGNLFTANIWDLLTKEQLEKLPVFETTDDMPENIKKFVEEREAKAQEEVDQIYSEAQHIWKNS